MDSISILYYFQSQVIESTIAKSKTRKNKRDA